MKKALIFALLSMGIFFGPFTATKAYSQEARTTLPAPSEELNTLLMHATFRIIGPSAKGAQKAATGTVFILTTPHPSGDMRLGTSTMVTAAHVLDDIAGDEASILIRRREENGQYTTFNYKIKLETMEPHCARSMTVPMLQQCFCRFQ
jgi:hypothetical protein